MDFRSKWIQFDLSFHLSLFMIMNSKHGEIIIKIKLQIHFDLAHNNTVCLKKKKKNHNNKKNGNFSPGIIRNVFLNPHLWCLNWCTEKSRAIPLGTICPVTELQTFFMPDQFVSIIESKEAFFFVQINPKFLKAQENEKTKTKNR